MAITKERIDGLIVTIQNLYMADDIPWMIGYSGGKDSTAAVQLVWMAMEQLSVEERNKPIHIMNTDTLVESPVVSKWVEKSLERMRIEAEQKRLPFVPERLIPEYNNTFWVNLIGRGYPYPRKKYRWCTDRLKIQPVNKFIKNKIAEHGEVILVLGTRKQESARRNRTMTNLEKKRVRELLSPNPTLANELVFSPMEDWTDDDVWAFLMQYKNPWGYSNMDLMTMYRGATAGISVLDVLSNDILRNLKKLNKTGSEEKSVEKILVLREEKELAIEDLMAIDAEKEKMNQKLIKDNDLLAALHQSYTAKGGDVVEKRQEILKARANLMAELSNVKDRLHELMADVLPLLLVEDLVVDIKLQATDEHTDLIMQEAVLQLDNIFEDFAEGYVGDKKAGIDFIEYTSSWIVYKRSGRIEQENIFLNSTYT
ncbi:DNA phosphorothioation system sulfurtransferase DndC [Clostridiaceae bacterium AF42-6]|nr:DNA phosphorothioation system sulfurtransferase DndC [Clostridiaceae bacterium AF42-6]